MAPPRWPTPKSTWNNEDDLLLCTQLAALAHGIGGALGCRRRFSQPNLVACRYNGSKPCRRSMLSYKEVASVGEGMSFQVTSVSSSNWRRSAHHEPHAGRLSDPLQTSLGPFRLVVGATFTAEQINLIEGALRSATRRSGRQLKSWNGKGSLRLRCKTGIACTYAMHFDRVKSSSAPSWRVSFIASQHSCAPHEIDIHPELEANLRFFPRLSFETGNSQQAVAGVRPIAGSSSMTALADNGDDTDDNSDDCSDDEPETTSVMVARALLPSPPTTPAYRSASQATPAACTLSSAQTSTTPSFSPPPNLASAEQRTLLGVAPTSAHRSTSPSPELAAPAFKREDVETVDLTMDEEKPVISHDVGAGHAHVLPRRAERAESLAVLAARDLGRAPPASNLSALTEEDEEDPGAPERRARLEHFFRSRLGGVHVPPSRTYLYLTTRYTKFNSISTSQNLSIIDLLVHEHMEPEALLRWWRTKRATIAGQLTNFGVRFGDMAALEDALDQEGEVGLEDQPATPTPTPEPKPKRERELAPALTEEAREEKERKRRRKEKKKAKKGKGVDRSEVSRSSSEAAEAKSSTWKPKSAKKAKRETV